MAPFIVFELLSNRVSGRQPAVMKTALVHVKHVLSGGDALDYCTVDTD